MVWLNDVKSGGGTAFIHPNKGLLLEPRKGSMAFWISTKANTDVLENSRHGGCPVCTAISSHSRSVCILWSDVLVL